MAKVRISQLSKRFPVGDELRLVLDNVSLEIEAGEFLCILGPSGCGKTTLLNLLAGIIPITEGQITIDGQLATGPGPDRAYVFQDHALFPWMTVQDNVAFGLESRGRPRGQARTLARELLGTLGLGDFAEYYPRRISGGMKQRVNLARALAVNPDIVLMDEPFAALDAQTRFTLHGELLAIWETLKKTIIFITHNIDEAMYLADRIAVMSHRPGRIKEIVTVRLPRPRDDTDPAYVQQRHHLFTLIAEEMGVAGTTPVSGELAAVLSKAGGR
jgi:NitT/TauT family transport system ATP-binding protein